MRIPRSRIAILGLVLVAALAPASAASAAPIGGDIDPVVVGVNPAPANRALEIPMDCPNGSRITGTGIGNMQSRAVVPNTNFTGAVLHGFTRPQSTIVSGHLLCAPTSQFGDVRTFRQTVPKQPGEGAFRRGTLRCPGGMYAFGGAGYFVGPNQFFRAAVSDNVSNGPTLDGTGWTYAGVAPAATDDLVIAFQCAPGIADSVVVTSTFTVVGDSNGRVSGYATCPSDAIPVAGGFKIVNADNTDATTGNVTYSNATNRFRPFVDSWFVEGNASIGKKVLAIAQCIEL